MTGSGEDKEAVLSTIRQKTLKDIDNISSKPRFGYFTSPAPLAIGDNSLFQQKTIVKDEMGKPKTQPPNMKYAPGKLGKVKSSYFKMDSFVTIGDKYMDPGKLERQEKMKQQSQIPEGATQFKPATLMHKTVTKASYPYQADKIPDDFKVKNYRDENGNVKVMPPNPSTGMPKYPHKFPKHIPDEYNRKQELIKQERLKEIEIMTDKPRFKSSGPVNPIFNSDKITYGTNIKFAEKKISTLDLKSMQHDAPFKYPNPSRKDIARMSLAPFPKYMENPPREIKRQEEQEKTKDVFKPNRVVAHPKPCPSISLNFFNLKKEFSSPALFGRH